MLQIDLRKWPSLIEGSSQLWVATPLRPCHTAPEPPQSGATKALNCDIFATSVA